MRALAPRLLALGALALGAGAAAAQGTVVGELRYVDREFTFAGGFTGVVTERPVPRAQVTVLDGTAGGILGQGFTDLDGRYAVALGGAPPASVRVRALTVSAPYGSFRVRATDAGGTPYSVTSPALSAAGLPGTLDAGVLVAQPSAGPGFVGGPFGLLDLGVRALEYATAQGAGPLPADVGVVWPVAGGSFATFDEAHISSDDGFDDLVVLHELGHVLHHLYSQSDNPGGAHGFTQSDQDPALAFGEGWASYFAGAVRQHALEPDPGFYLDCDGDGSSGPGTIQLHMRFEDGAPYAALTGGEADEGAVFCALWDLVDTAATDDGFAGDDDALDGSLALAPGLDGDAALWAALTGPQVLGAQALHVVDLWNGLFLDAGCDRYAEASAALAAWKIRVLADPAEPDDDLAGATLLPLGDAWSGTRTLYRSDRDPPVPGDGDEDVFLVDLPAGLQWEVETRYPGGAADAETYCDTRLRVLSPQGAVIAVATSGGAGKNAKASNLSSAAGGQFRFVVDAELPLRPTGSYEVRARLTGAAGGPTVQFVLPSAVESLKPTSAPLVSVFGTGLLGVDAVSVGSVPVPEWTMLGDTQLRFTLPLPNELGPVPVTVSGPFGSDSALLLVSPPATPVVNSNNGATGWPQAGDLLVELASQPFDVVLLFVGANAQPTVLPGVLDLDIGGGLAGLHLLLTKPLGAAGTGQRFFDLAPLPPGTPVHLQAGVLRAPTFALPLVSSNAISATVFP